MSASGHDFDTAFDAAHAQVAQGRAPRAPDGAPPSGTDADCPIRPLGHRGGRYRLFNAAGELREVAEDKLQNGAILVSLLGGATDWAIRHFVQLDKDGNPTSWFSTRALGRWIVAECHQAGLINDAEPMRGWGVWRAGGVVVLHLGDVVWLPATREARRAGFREWGALWPALPRAFPRAAADAALPEPAAPEAAAEVEALFTRWTWEQPYAPAIVTGLWAAGLMGAAIRWRPHGLVVGQAGTGKTTLFDTLAALNPLAAAWNDYTEAGLRQALTGRAAPLLLDEAEGDPDGGSKLTKVIELLRRASGGAGAQTVRGSPGGQSQHFEVTSQALMGGILPPVLLPQDESRFTRVDLRPPPPPEELGETVPAPLPDEAELLAWRQRAPAFLARALAGMGRFAANLLAYRAAIIARGCMPRLVDQVGTILAARATLLRDAPVTAEQAAADCSGLFVDLLAPPAERAMEDGPGAVLVHLLQQAADVQRHGERPSIATLLREARGTEGDASRRVLVDHGLALAPWPPGTREVPGGPPHLFVANTHPRLAKLFDGTRWAGGRWKEDLRRLPGAVLPGPRRELGDAKPRCTIVPAPLPVMGEGWRDDGSGTVDG